MKPRVKGALLLLLAFGLGVGAGVAGYACYQARFGWRHAPQEGRFQQIVLARLTKELDLRPEQRQQVESVLKETGQEFARLREEIAPRYRDIRTRARDRIRAALDAGQQAKFDVLEKEWARRAERWHGRDARPGGDEGKAR